MELPAYLDKLRGRHQLGNARAGVRSGRPPHISIRDNMFRLVSADGGEEIITTADNKLGSFMDCVITSISPHTSRLYYTKNYESGDQENPTCFSDDGVYPSDDADEKQSERCDICPQNAWGSKITAQGKRSKACQEGKPILLFVPDHGFFQFRITPGSFKNWTQYVQKLIEREWEPQFFITRLWFQSQGVLTFAAQRMVPEDMIDSIDLPQEKLDGMLKAKPETTLPSVGAAAAPIRVAAPKPAPVQEPSWEEDLALATLKPNSAPHAGAEAPGGRPAARAAKKVAPGPERISNPRGQAAKGQPEHNFGITEDLAPPPASLADEITAAFSLDVD